MVLALAPGLSSLRPFSPTKKPDLSLSIASSSPASNKRKLTLFEDGNLFRKQPLQLYGKKTPVTMKSGELLQSSPCGHLSELETPEKWDNFHWNALICAFSKDGRWEEALDTFYGMISYAHLLPDDFTLPCVLKACAGVLSVEVGRQVHGVSVKIGLHSNTFICNSLISMYARCLYTEDALQMFDGMPMRNLVSWNTMLRGLFEAGFYHECLYLFRDLLLEGETLQLDEATLVSVLPVCGSEGLVNLGRSIHALALKLCLLRFPKVCNSLLDMYFKCGIISEAEYLFREINPKNNVTWNIMIGGLAKNGEASKTLILLREMTSNIKSVDDVTLLNASAACFSPIMIKSLRELHGHALRNGFLSNELLNAFITGYFKCGSSIAAENIFFSLFSTMNKNSWNALIGGHVQNGNSQKAVKIFLKMVLSGLKPDKFSIASILSALTRMMDLRCGKSVHGFIYRSFLHEDTFILISLLSLYIQCREVNVAETIFSMMEEKSSVAWNTMISGMAHNRLPGSALGYFRMMIAQHCQLSAVAVAAAFSAIGQVSARKLGQELHCYCLRTNEEEDLFVSSSAVDMYAKCGAIDDARKLFDMIKNREVVLWNVMIMGYGVHGRGSEAVDLLRMMEREKIMPDDCTFLGVLSACNHAGMVKLGFRVFEEMKTKYGMNPKMEHAACMADMLARAGRVDEATAMGVEQDDKFLSSLLGACTKYGKFEMGEEIARRLLSLEKNRAEHYVLASNLYAASGKWEEVWKLRKRMRDMGLVKEAGCSWINVDGKIYEFMAGDL